MSRDALRKSRRVLAASQCLLAAEATPHHATGNREDSKQWMPYAVASQNKTRPGQLSQEDDRSGCALRTYNEFRG